jgi:hypothetical protein
MLCLAAGGAHAQQQQQADLRDLRDLRVGMALAELPQAGYADFTCAGSDAKPIAGWAGFRACAADNRGEREVAFRYDDTPEHTTQVAGQPVRLSLVLDGDGVVTAIKMQTDPGGRVFTRKRAVHFGESVMAHYGQAGWACTEAGPTARELPVGRVFIRKHCEKTLGNRHLVVDRALFRGADQPADSFTSISSFSVALVKPGVR